MKVQDLLENGGVQKPQLEGIVAGHDLLEAVMAGPTLPSCIYLYLV